MLKLYFRFRCLLRGNRCRALGHLRLALGHLLRARGALAVAGDIQHKEQDKKGQEAD